MQLGDLYEVLVEVQKKKDLPLSAVPGKASWKRLHFIWILKIRNGVLGVDSAECESKWRCGSCEACVTGKGLYLTCGRGTRVPEEWQIAPGGAWVWVRTGWGEGYACLFLMLIVTKMCACL